MSSVEPVYRKARLAAPGSIVRAGETEPDTWATIVTPEELERLLELDAAEAGRVSELVQITIEAYCWPNVIGDPVPPPVHLVGLSLAARFAGAQLSKAGSIAGESIGAYSYRLATPLTLDDVLTLLGELAEELNFWAPRHSTAYTLTTWPGPSIPWPADWWQRDLDRLWAGDWP